MNIGLRILMTAACLAASARAALKDNLGMFFTLNPQDSIVSLTQKSASTLSIEVFDQEAFSRRTLQEEVGSKPLAKLLADARAEGVAVNAMPAPGETSGAAPATSGQKWPSDSAEPRVKETPRAETAPAEPPKAPRSARSLSSQRKNRTSYMLLQIPLSTWVYGLAIPLALDVDNPRVLVAAPLLAAPVSFAGHFWFAKDRNFEDSHLKGANYLSLASLYSSYALSFALLDWDRNVAYRTAAFASIATYPVGIWAGYMQGDRYVDLPGRIATQANFALSFGILGFFSPFLYFEHMNDHTRDVLRLGLGQSVAFGTVGHFVADYYRQGENIPGGVTMGILNHAALGAGLGFEVAALSDASTVRPWVGAGLAGGTVGFMEGLFYYRSRNDSKERGFYNAVGTAAGALMGTGVVILVWDDKATAYEQKVMTTSLLLGGSLIGYAVTDFLTRGMEERAEAKPSWTDRLAVNLLPMPEPQVRDHSLYYRYRVPGVTFRF